MAYGGASAAEREASPERRTSGPVHGSPVRPFLSRYMHFFGPTGNPVRVTLQPPSGTRQRKGST